MDPGIFIGVAGFVVTILINAAVVVHRFSIMEQRVKLLMISVNELTSQSKARVKAMEDIRQEFTLITYRLEEQIKSNERRITQLEYKNLHADYGGGD